MRFELGSIRTVAGVNGKIGQQMAMVCGGRGAIFLFSVLLIFRLGIPEKLLSGAGETVSPPQANIPAGEAWMNITQDGRKIGYAQRTIHPDGRRIPLFREYLHADQYDGDCPAPDGPDGGGAETRPDALQLSI